MTFRKLEKSLLLRVEERVRELLPEAHVRSTRHTVTIKWQDLKGEVPVRALTTLCLGEERSNWGAIAGGYCNLIESRTRAWFGPALSDDSQLERVFPAVMTTSEDDALIYEAAPVESLQVASVPWLDGLRIEFDYRGDGAYRRLFRRDLEALGLTAEDVLERANANMAAMIDHIPLSPVGPTEPHQRIFVARSEGMAPALLCSEAGHQVLLDTLAAVEQTGKVLACAPRSGLLYFCNMRDKAAASRMVALAWQQHGEDDDSSVPLSPRLFTIASVGKAKYLDFGLKPDRVASWNIHPLGLVRLCVPEDWWVSEQDGRHVIWRTDDGPRLRVRLVESGAGSALAGHELAERVRARHNSTSDIGHGFFNGLPWAWVDTGFHGGFATASMFVVCPEGMAIVQTEIPEGAASSDQLTLQKIIATVAPIG